MVAIIGECGMTRTRHPVKRHNSFTRCIIIKEFERDLQIYLEGMARDAKGSSNEGGNKRHLVPL